MYLNIICLFIINRSDVGDRPGYTRSQRAAPFSPWKSRSGGPALSSCQCSPAGNSSAQPGYGQDRGGIQGGQRGQGCWNEPLHEDRSPLCWSGCRRCDCRWYPGNSAGGHHGHGSFLQRNAVQCYLQSYIQRHDIPNFERIYLHCKSDVSSFGVAFRSAVRVGDSVSPVYHDV